MPENDCKDIASKVAQKRIQIRNLREKKREQKGKRIGIEANITQEVNKLEKLKKDLSDCEKNL